MMAVLEDSIKLIRDSYHEEVDLAHLPQDDELVYKALQKADTIGLFQVESRAQMSCLPRLRPLVDYPFLMIEGALQNQDNVVSVKAKRIRPLSFTIAAAPSHDFH